MAEPRPDLLILGDSHSVALKDGCDRLGLRAELLSFSGNFWHQGHIFLHRSRGLWAKGRALQDRIETVGARMGVDNILQSGVPVLTSFGFHLGRIVPPFGYLKHTADPAIFAADPESHFASRGLVEAYWRAYRDVHVRMLARLAGLVPTLAVTPPNVFAGDNYRAFFEVTKSMIRDAGVALFDPCEALFGPGNLLPDDMITADRVHGDARYGERVMAHILDTHLLPARRD